MSPNILLRVPRSDNDSECLLVQVAATNNSLDLTLQATEGEGTFEATLSESAISDCRANNSKATDDDLKAILQHLFLKKPPRDPKLVEGLELSAVALGKEAEDGYELRVKKSIGKFRHSIASIKIPPKEIEISIFDWAADSLKALYAAEEEARKHRSGAEEKDKTIAYFRTQLETLTELKKEHEEQLLVKFKKILDAKKAKIRDLEKSTVVAEDASEESETGVSPKRVKTNTPSAEPEPAKGRERKTPAPKATPKKAAPKKAAPKKAAAKPKPASPVRVTRKRKIIAPPYDSEDDFVPMDVDEPPKRTTRASKAPEKPPVDDRQDSETGDEEDAAISNNKDSEDELPPIRIPIEFQVASNPSQSPPTAPATLEKAVSEPEDGTDDETDDEL